MFVLSPYMPSKVEMVVHLRPLRDEFHIGLEPSERR